MRKLIFLSIFTLCLFTTTQSQAQVVNPEVGQMKSDVRSQLITLAKSAELSGPGNSSTMNKNITVKCSNLSGNQWTMVALIDGQNYLVTWTQGNPDGMEYLPISGWFAGTLC